ncbi:MAG: hypothetical protein WCA31_13655 [Acidimicrobiales bacterium]
MGIQEQAFRSYYSSMTDAKLLETAAHKSSFVGLAQKVLSEELSRRNLTLPEESSEPVAATDGPGTFSAMWHKFMRH